MDEHFRFPAVLENSAEGASYRNKADDEENVEEEVDEFSENLLNFLIGFQRRGKELYHGAVISVMCFPAFRRREVVVVYNRCV